MVPIPNIRSVCWFYGVYLLRSPSLAAVHSHICVKHGFFIYANVWSFSLVLLLLFLSYIKLCLPRVNTFVFDCDIHANFCTILCFFFGYYFYCCCWFWFLIFGVGVGVFVKTYDILNVLNCFSPIKFSQSHQTRNQIIQSLNSASVELDKRSIELSYVNCTSPNHHNMFLANSSVTHVQSQKIAFNKSKPFFNGIVSKTSHNDNAPAEQ